jgi:tetratricopeptide (TPR) repeat protein
MRRVSLAWLFSYLLAVIVCICFATGCGSGSDQQSPKQEGQQDEDLGTTQQSQADPQREALMQLLMIRVGKIDLHNNDGQTLTSSFTVIDSDLIVTRASYLLDAVDASVRLECCDPRSIVGVVGSDFGRDIAIVRVDPPFEGIDALPLASAHPQAGEGCTIIYTLPIEFEVGPAYSEHPTFVYSTPNWSGVEGFGLFRYDNELILPGSLVINAALEPVAVLTRWGGGSLDMGVWLDDLDELERHDPIPIEAFTLATIQPDERSQANALLSGLYRHNGRFEMAKQAAEHSIEFDPTNWYALYQLGVLTDMVTTDLSLSALYLKQSIEREGDWVESVYSLGLVRYKQGRFSDAEAAFERALMIDSEHPDSLAMLGLSLWKLTGVQSAIGTLELACDNAPDQYGFLSNYVNAMSELDRESETIERLKAFVEEEPEHEEAREKLAYVVFRAKRFELAEDLFEQLCQAPEPAPDLLTVLAYCQINLGKLDQAQASLGRLMLADPNHWALAQLNENLREARDE